LDQYPEHGLAQVLHSFPCSRHDQIDAEVRGVNRSGYSGKDDPSSTTFRLTETCTGSLSISSKTSAMSCPISTISASFIPLVVTAGVPIRMPLVTSGGCWSNGIVFLLTVIRAFSSACSACLPVIP